MAIPLALASAYLTLIARPQHASRVTFTVWAGETTAISESQSGIARVASAPRNSDAAILSEFLGIPTLLGRLDRRPALLSRYSEPWALA